MPGARAQKRRSRGLYTEGHDPKEGEGCAQNMVRAERNIRLGVNAFFCALAEASRAHEGHCLVTWRPEHWVRTRATEIKPDGFGRYLYPGAACDFYLEYDRGTEAFGALARKLEGYLKLAAGWTKEQELLGFPNLLIIVPEGVREGEVGSAWQDVLRTAIRLAGNCHTAYLKARPSVRRRLNDAVLEAVYIKDRKMGRAEFSEVFGPLFSRPSSNKAMKVDLAGRCVNRLPLLFALRSQASA